MANLITFGLPLVSRSISEVHGAEFARLLSRHLGAPVESRVALSYNELADRLVEGRIDYGWLPPVDAWQLARHAGVDLLLRAIRVGQSHYYSILFTRADSPLETLADLGGKRVAWVHRRSAAGFLVASARLVAMGIQPAQPPMFLGSHEAVVRAVADGRADAGATYGSLEGIPGESRVVETGWQQITLDPPCDMRPLATCGPFPTDAICAWPGTSRKARADVVRAFQAMEDEAEGARVMSALFGTSRFVPIQTADVTEMELALRGML